MTSAQLEPSAHAPCTSTTFRASAGLAGRADAPAAKNVAKSILMATTATVHGVFFDPWMYFFTALRRFSPIVTLLFLVDAWRPKHDRSACAGRRASDALR